MNKAQLVEAVAKASNHTKTQADAIVTVVLEEIKRAVKKGNDVTLLGFGTFTRNQRKARTGRNPQTGAEIKISARTVPKFRAGREFKKALRKT